MLSFDLKKHALLSDLKLFIDRLNQLLLRYLIQVVRNRLFVQNVGRLVRIAQYFLITVDFDPTQEQVRNVDAADFGQLEQVDRFVKITLENRKAL